jgi:hypothetical protein
MSSNTERELYAFVNKLPLQFSTLTLRGCDLTAEWLAANEHVRVQFLAAAPISNTPRASLRSRVSKTQPTWGSTTAACHFERYLKSGSGHAFAKKHFWPDAKPHA